MPIAAQSSFGLALPAVFAVGTAMPLLLIMLLAQSFDFDRFTLKWVFRAGLVAKSCWNRFIVPWHQ